MCVIKRRRNSGVKVVKMHLNHLTNIGVELTRMTTKSGRITYAVQVRRLDKGYKYRLWTYDNILAAWNQYKAALA